ncbi:MAG: copper-binding protein [Burkholderiales bacterium]
MKLALTTFLLAAVLGAPAHAQPDAAAALSDGEIRKVDPEARKITIRHGPISNLGMPPMTMVFQVDDPALLENVKAGDKVRFTAEKNDGRYIVRQLQKNP